VYIADVKKTMARLTIIDKSGLNTRFDIDNLSDVDIVDGRMRIFAFHIQLFELAILQHRDSALLTLRNVD